MPSIVWGRHPQEAYDNPYEYDAQSQFLREAKALLEDLNIRLDGSTLRYHRDDKTPEKATWMLALDLVDSLLESRNLLEERRHRVAARMFRDIVESIDILRVLNSGTARGSKALASWYENETIPHREAREYLQEVEGEPAARARKVFYTELSKFTHRTYRALLHSYSLGRDDLLVHDSHSMGHLVLPQTIASYLAVLADLIIQASSCFSDCGAIPEAEIQYSWQNALETLTVPRRFAMS